jgi:glycosyltransferase involved in cell wall biosynthesis
MSAASPVVVKGGATADTPLVSVVVPAYNVARYIAQALSSAMAQTFGRYEVIVVNDGSPDSTALEAVLSPFRDQIVYVKQQNQGVSAARNHAIRRARGEYVAFLDADDEWLPHYLEDQLARAAANPHVSILYGDAEIFGDVAQAGRRFMELSPSRGEVDFRSLVTQRCTVMTSAMVRRSVFARVGPLDERLRSSEDFDFWLRAAHHGMRFAYTRRVLSRYRRREGSLSADPIWMSRHILIVLDKCLHTLELTEPDRAVVREHRQRVAAELRFYEGKRAFFQRDFTAARNALEEANRVMRSRKLSLAILILRVAPRLLGAVYDARDRVLFRGARTKF